MRREVDWVALETDKAFVTWIYDEVDRLRPKPGVVMASCAFSQSGWRDFSNTYPTRQDAWEAYQTATKGGEMTNG